MASDLIRDWFTYVSTHPRFLRTLEEKKQETITGTYCKEEIQSSMIRVMRAEMKNKKIRNNIGEYKQK